MAGALRRRRSPPETLPLEGTYTDNLTDPEIGTRFRRRRKEEGNRESTAGKRRAVCPQTARSVQHETQAKRDKRQIQVANNRGQVTNRKAASRQETRVTQGEGTNTDPQQPASARPNPSQNLNRTCPSRPNRTDCFGRPGPNQPCAADRIGLHWFAAANNRPRQ